jgi:hypothetical protein
MKRRLAVPPLGIKRDDLADFIGSEQLTRDMIKEQWLVPIVNRTGLMLFAVRDAERALTHLEDGRAPENSDPAEVARVLAHHAERKRLAAEGGKRRKAAPPKKD